ncbi:MAG TPA: YdeI/OmpD-associated family protein [Gemmatimonadaceae bacterium]|nr:YdeI/OmpD-associated family protein [Gemmatimonadaceae bacterium]
MIFQARIRITGVNPYVLVSASRATAIKPDWRKPIPVLVRINGEPKAQPWRINMMPMGNGAFYLYLHGDVRRASGTEVGDLVRVDVVFDADYRSGPRRLPDWFRVPLSRDPVATATWNALTPSRQKEIVRYLANLKTPEARMRNLARTLAALSARPASPG